MAGFSNILVMYSMILKDNPTREQCEKIIRRIEEEDIPLLKQQLGIFEMLIEQAKEKIKT